MSSCFKIFAHLNEGQFASNDFELVIKISKDVEHILQTEFNASGPTLTAKVKSIEKKIPDHVKFKLHFLERVREKLIHDEKIPNRTDYIKTYAEVKSEMAEIVNKPYV
ncbi:unnamed protein product, partial [Heterosigma akashiwo]